jgi:hypothetical protein
MVDDLQILVTFAVAMAPRVKMDQHFVTTARLTVLGIAMAVRLWTHAMFVVDTVKHAQLLTVMMVRRIAWVSVMVATPMMIVVSVEETALHVHVM